MSHNIILKTDSYKFSHYKQYPPKTEYVRSYIEPRGISTDFINTNEIVFFGLQMFLKKYLVGEVVTQEYIDEAEEISSLQGVPFNKKGWQYILDVHNGHLPIEIEALPEGAIHGIGIPQVQIINTDPNCFWLTSYIETSLLRSIWYPSTVSTLSRETKKLIMGYLKLTSDDTSNQIGFKLHDFGARGVSSSESASIGGLAHLVNFVGSDTVEAISYARKYYDEIQPSFSIPASEHSTMTSWGETNETSAYRNMISKFGGDGNMFAVVSDSYDIKFAVDKIWGEFLKDEVINSNSTLVCRPDSGDPVKIIQYILESFGKTFGYTTNSKGYKVLNNVRVIQGDGINYNIICNILKRTILDGWSIDNIAFGMGGGLLQKVNRDNLQYAMKTNEICIDSIWKDVYKRPIGDSGKSSKSGRQYVYKDIFGDFYSTDEKHSKKYNYLQPVFRNGKLLTEYTFEEVRKNAH